MLVAPALLYLVDSCLSGSTREGCLRDSDWHTRVKGLAHGVNLGCCTTKPTNNAKSKEKIFFPFQRVKKKKKTFFWERGPFKSGLWLGSKAISF